MNYRDIIRDVLRDNPDMVEPADIAEAAFKKLTKGAYAQVLLALLVQAAREVMGTERRRGLGRRPRGKQAPSWKRDAVRAWLARHRFEGANGWLKLDTASYDDLLFAAKERRDKAATEVTWAEWYERVAEVVEPGGHVKDVDPLKLPEPPNGW